MQLCMKHNTNCNVTNSVREVNITQLLNFPLYIMHNIAFINELSRHESNSLCSIISHWITLRPEASCFEYVKTTKVLHPTEVLDLYLLILECEGWGYPPPLWPCYTCSVKSWEMPKMKSNRCVIAVSSSSFWGVEMNDKTRLNIKIVCGVS